MKSLGTVVRIALATGGACLVLYLAFIYYAAIEDLSTVPVIVVFGGLSILGFWILGTAVLAGLAVWADRRPPPDPPSFPPPP
jgi:hypothetical protein